MILILIVILTLEKTQKMKVTLMIQTLMTQTLMVIQILVAIQTLEICQPLKMVKALEEVNHLKLETLKLKTLNKFRDHKESETSPEDMQNLTCCKTLK